MSKLIAANDTFDSVSLGLYFPDFNVSNKYDLKWTELSRLKENIEPLCDHQYCFQVSVSRGDDHAKPQLHEHM